MNNILYLIIPVGISGSGKSTLCNRLKDEYSAAIVETDAIRKELTGNEEDQSRNGQVFSLAKSRVSGYLKRGKNVIIDATNIKIKDRKDFIDIGKSIGNCKILCYYIRPNLEKAKKQNSLRKRVVPDFVLDKQFNAYQPPTTLEGFDDIFFID